MLQSAGLEIVAWDQPDAAVAVVDLGLPPSVVLMTEHGQVVSFGEPQFLGYRCLVHVQSSSCAIVSRRTSPGWPTCTYQSAGWAGRPANTFGQDLPRSCSAAVIRRRTGPWPGTRVVLSPCFSGIHKGLRLLGPTGRPSRRRHSCFGAGCSLGTTTGTLLGQNRSGRAIRSSPGHLRACRARWLETGLSDGRRKGWERGTGGHLRARRSAVAVAMRFEPGRVMRREASRCRACRAGSLEMLLGLPLLSGLQCRTWCESVPSPYWLPPSWLSRSRPGAVRPTLSPVLGDTKVVAFRSSSWPRLDCRERAPIEPFGSQTPERES